MRQKKMVKSNPLIPIPIPKESTAEVSEVHALLDIMKAIKKKEVEQTKKELS